MDFFNDILVGQCVVLALLLFATLRPKLKKTQNSETFSVFSVIAVFLSSLCILIYGLSIMWLVLLLLSLLVFITNIASLYRLTNSLYTVRSSLLFCFFSYLEAFLSVICLVACFFFQPAIYNSSIQEKTLYTGSFSRGFTEKVELLSKTNLIVTEYSEPESIQNTNNIAVVYISTIGTTSEDSALRLSTIAEMGVNVFTGDFYAQDALKTGTEIDLPRNANPILTPYTLHFMSKPDLHQKDAFLEQKALELEVLLSLAGQKYSSVLIFAEGDIREVALEARRKYPNFVAGIFSSTEDDVLEFYYGKGIADFALMNPLDALLSKFDTFDEYTTFRSFAKTEKPHLRIARLIVGRIKELSAEVL